MPEAATGRRLLAEGIGTAFLLVAIVGSGIAAERLTDDAALRLLTNAVVTGAAIAALISALGPISGGHFNPAVTAVDRVLGGASTGRALGYVGAQVAGAVAGTVVADLLFSLPAAEVSTTVRSGAGLWLSEAVATFGLVSVILLMAGTARARSIPATVGAYVGAAILFSSSTGFANPAATIGRTLTDTFAGIAPRSAPAFLLAQIAGATFSVAAVALLRPRVRESAPAVVLDSRDDASGTAHGDGAAL